MLGASECELAGQRRRHLGRQRPPSLARGLDVQLRVGPGGGDALDPCRPREVERAIGEAHGALRAGVQPGLGRCLASSGHDLRLNGQRPRERPLPGQARVPASLYRRARATRECREVELRALQRPRTWPRASVTSAAIGEPCQRAVRRASPVAPRSRSVNGESTPSRRHSPRPAVPVASSASRSASAGPAMRPVSGTTPRRSRACRRAPSSARSRRASRARFVSRAPARARAPRNARRDAPAASSKSSTVTSSEGDTLSAGPGGPEQCREPDPGRPRHETDGARSSRLPVPTDPRAVSPGTSSPPPAPSS